MILFSIEYYPRKVWSACFPCAVEGRWNDSAILQTTTLFHFKWRRRKFVVRFRYWHDRGRFGIEYKYSFLIWKNKNSKFVSQNKIGVYFPCTDSFWYFMHGCLPFRPKIKTRESMIWKNIRITLDNKKKLEIKFHSKPII